MKRTFWQYLTKGQPAWIWVILVLVLLGGYGIYELAWLAVGIWGAALAVILIGGYIDYRENG